MTIFVLMNKLIHIPHSSVYIPEKYMGDYIVSSEEVKSIANILMDHGTDKLAGILPAELFKDNVVQFPYSRIFCDVERFNSEEEEMNDIGMGVLYTHSHELKEIRRVKDKESIFKYYHEHHKLLDDKCENLLKKYGEVMFIDLHSYYNESLPYEKHKDLKRPDICIGIEEFHLNKNHLENLINMIESYGYTWSINEPFIGCLIPNKYYMKDKRVSGFMFEVNKNVFNDFEKISELFKKIVFDK